MVKEELEEVEKRLRETEPCSEKEKWSTGLWGQFTVLLERSLKERRHESFSGLKIAQIVIASILAGILWFRSQGRVQDQVYMLVDFFNSFPFSCIKYILSRRYKILGDIKINILSDLLMGLIFNLVNIWSFTPIFEALFTFPREHKMLSKEHSSCMYRLSSYFMARLVGDLPMELILPTVSITITYWMCGLKPTAFSCMAFLLITLFSVLVWQGLGLAIGDFIMDTKKASIFTSILMRLLSILGGFYVQKVPVFVAWVQYIAISFHMFKLLLLTQFTTADIYKCAQGQRCSVTNLPQVKAVGLEHQEFDIIAMFAMLVFFRFLAYMGLRRIGVPD